MSDIVVGCTRDQYLSYLRTGRSVPGARFTLSKPAKDFPDAQPLERMYLYCDGSVRGFLIIHSVEDAGDATGRPMRCVTAYLSTWRWITPIAATRSSAIRSADRMGITRREARVVGDFTTPPIQIPPPPRGH